jgi:hypothetical protein
MDARFGKSMAVIELFKEASIEYAETRLGREMFPS